MAEISDIDEFAEKLIQYYGAEKAIKIIQELTRKIEGTLKKARPCIRYGPNPSHVKTLLKTMSGGKIVNLEDAHQILVSQFSEVEDSKRTYTIGILDWNKDVFQRVSSKRGDRRWQLTKYGEDLAKRLSNGKDIDDLDKALLKEQYLNDPITNAVYEIFKGHNRTRKEGIQLLKTKASQLGITPEQAEYYMGEKTSALVALGLLERKRGKQTIYT
jgi:hypothetical protein